ncbi:hypothetical protein CMO88_00335 [Candidatus Woesearchaeota archaeon]|nr:hypothetical protein [Candidatus Woesearchaeota archaeon]|tara:strand:- start:57832 stop:58095 length:264 start_codon:yes stop_codon:yes gene_type:complete
MGFLGLFGGRRSGKTVAEKRVDNSSKITKLATEIHRLQSRVVWIERNAPYEKNNRRRKQMDLDKLKLEQRIQSLERQHHALSSRNKG